MTPEPIKCAECRRKLNVGESAFLLDVTTVQFEPLNTGMGSVGAGRDYTVATNDPIPLCSVACVAKRAKRAAIR